MLQMQRQRIVETCAALEAQVALDPDDVVALWRTRVDQCRRAIPRPPHRTETSGIQSAFERLAVERWVDADQMIVGEECVLHLRWHEVVGRRLRGVGAHRLPPERDVRRRVDDGRDRVVRGAHLGERGEQRRAVTWGGTRSTCDWGASASWQCGDRRVTDHDVVAVTVAAVERRSRCRVGAHRCDRRGSPPRRSCRRLPASRAQDRRRHPSRGSRGPRRRPHRGSRPRPAARPRAPRRAVVVPMSIAGSPSSPRVAQITRASTPLATACASTDPSPNVSSSGCATGTSNRSGRAELSMATSPSCPSRI